MEAQGWKAIRLQAGTVKSIDGRRFITLCERGTPDWIYVRRHNYLFVEKKRPGEELAPDQVIWFAWAAKSEVAAVWADSLDMFMEKYVGLGY